MSQERKRILMCLAAPDFDPEVAMNLFGPRLGERFGGASMLPQRGIWSADALVERPQYTKGVNEPGLQLTVSVMPNDLEAALTWLRAEIAAANQAHCWGLDWIHTEVTDVAARHFSLAGGEPEPTA